MISNKNTLKHLVSATSGEFYTLDEICTVDNKKQFIGKIGYAVQSDNNIIYSPCSGTVIGISEKQDLFTIYSHDGLIVRINVGLENYYTPENILSYVHLYDEVIIGQIIAIYEKKYILPSSKKLITPVYVENAELIKTYSLTPTGRMEGGKSISLTYKI